MADDRQLREMTCDPKFRKVLITDGQDRGRAGPGERASSAAGADLHLAGPGRAVEGSSRGSPSSVASCRRSRSVPLDLTDARSVPSWPARLASRSTSWSTTPKYHRTHGIASRHGTDVARAEMEVNYFGLLRLAQEFGPVMRARGADGTAERRRLGQPALGLRAEQLPGARHVLGVEGRGALAVAVPARGDAAGAACAS